MSAHESWVEPPHEPNLEFHAFDSAWNRIPLDNPDIREGVDKIMAESEYLELARKLMIKKSEWFQALESDARTFLESLGFSNLPPLYLLREGPELIDLLMEEEEGDAGAVAIVDPLNRFALVRNEDFEQAALQSGDVHATSILVHELMHLANVAKHVSVHFPADSEREMNLREGFIYSKGDECGGGFLEEAICAYVGGLYVRARGVSQTGFTSISNTPRPYVPSHYIVGEYEEDGFPETVMGPDGYALEMIMWKLEQDGVMSGEDFVANILKTRAEETQADGMRQIIGALNTLETGLYKKLSVVQYGQQTWRDMCIYVYELVTGDIWPEQQEVYTNPNEYNG